MRIGYIGLGNLGGHMAMSLIRKGFSVTVHDRNQSLADRHVAAGAERAENAAVLAGACVRDRAFRMPFRHAARLHLDRELDARPRRNRQACRHGTGERHPRS